MPRDNDEDACWYTRGGNDGSCLLLRIRLTACDDLCNAQFTNSYYGGRRAVGKTLNVGFVGRLRKVNLVRVFELAEMPSREAVVRLSLTRLCHDGKRPWGGAPGFHWLDE